MRYLFSEIMLYKSLKQLVAVDPADKASGVVICSNVRWILRQYVSDKLIYGIVTLLVQSLIHRGEYLLHFVITFILYGECHCFILHIRYLPYRNCEHYIK